MIGDYPKRITVTGWAFKRKRFVDVHRKTIRFPLTSFFYKSNELINLSEEAVRSEENTYKQFENDEYGCKSDLMSKKESRNPFRNDHGYEKACGELDKLFNACIYIKEKGELIFNPPWNITDLATHHNRRKRK